MGYGYEEVSDGGMDGERALWVDVLWTRCRLQASPAARAALSVCLVS